MLTIATTNAFEFFSPQLLFHCYSSVDLLNPPPMCVLHVLVFIQYIYIICIYYIYILFKHVLFIYAGIDVHGGQRLILETLHGKH